MKVLTILSVLLVSAASDPVVKTWTFPELIFATGNKSERKTVEEMEYLEDAKYEMASSYGENNIGSPVHVVISSPSGRPTWSRQELEAEDPKPIENFLNFDNITTSEEARDFAREHAISMAYITMLRSGKEKNEIEVNEPGIDISKWNIHDLKNSLKDSKTHPDLKPYLEDAYLALSEQIQLGYRNESIVILTPLGLIPHKPKFGYKRKTTRRRVPSTTTKFRTLHPKGWGVRIR